MKRDRVYLPQMHRLPFGEQRLLAILESSFDGIFITDQHAIPVWCNHSYEVITGLSSKDVLGIPMQELVRRGTISKSSTIMALDQKKPVTLEQTFKTGKRVVVTSTPIFDDRDEICMVVTNVRDITELLLLQETLESQRELSARYDH